MFLFTIINLFQNKYNNFNNIFIIFTYFFFWLEIKSYFNNQFIVTTPLKSRSSAKHKTLCLTLLDIRALSMEWCPNWLDRHRFINIMCISFLGVKWAARPGWEHLVKLYLIHLVYLHRIYILFYPPDDNDDDITLWWGARLSFWLKIWFAFGFLRCAIASLVFDRSVVSWLLSLDSPQLIVWKTRAFYFYLLTIFGYIYMLLCVKIVRTFVCFWIQCGTRGLIGRTENDLNLWLSRGVFPKYDIVVRKVPPKSDCIFF